MSQPRPRSEHFLGELQSLVQAGFPIIHVSTHEEDRCLEVVRQIAERLAWEGTVWSTSRGCYSLDPRAEPQSLGQSLADLTAAIESFDRQASGETSDGSGFIFVLLDPSPYLVGPGINPIYRRRLRDFAIAIRTKEYHASCIIISRARAER